MRLGTVWGQRQRLLRGGLGGTDLCGAVVGGVGHVDFPHVGVGEANQRPDIVLIEPQCRLEKTPGSPRRLERLFLVPGGTTEKGVIDRVETARTLARRAAAL